MQVKPYQALNKTLPYLLMYIIGTAAMYLVSYKLAYNHLIFTLDDPYIHLAVAENILKGGYGINLQENSSPSSSILFPYILAALLKLKISGTWSALLINILPTIVSVHVLISYYHKKITEAKNTIALKWFPLIALLLVFSINAIALPFTGMENSLHVNLTILTFVGLIQLFEKGVISKVFLFSLILLPLIRFEGFALAGISILALFYEKKYKAAIFCMTSICIAVGFYFSYMHSLSLPLLPSSVLVKSSASANIFGLQILGTLFSLLKGFLLKITVGDAGTVFFLFVLYTFYIVIKEAEGWKLNIKNKILLVAALTIFAHLLAGSFGWFYRYEVYAVAIIIISIPFLIATKKSNTQTSILFFCLFYFSLSYLKPIIYTPLAGKGIYEQQSQMHLFATKFFSHNVAVNDLGLVSYKNDNYVLDLWGLGSEPVRKLRSNGSFNNNAIQNMVAEKQVKFAMIYDEWFSKQIPKEWLLVGHLITSKYGTAYPEVSFYLTDTSLKTEFINSLQNFKKGLPNGAKFEFSNQKQ